MNKKLTVKKENKMETNVQHVLMDSFNLMELAINKLMVAKHKQMPCVLNAIVENSLIKMVNVMIISKTVLFKALTFALNAF